MGVCVCEYIRVEKGGQRKIIRINRYSILNTPGASWILSNKFVFVVVVVVFVFFLGFHLLLFSQFGLRHLEMSSLLVSVRAN